jgi:hypothetical protein
MSKIGRNELCPCGSGKKYKKCHGGMFGRKGLRAADDHDPRQRVSLQESTSQRFWAEFHRAVGFTHSGLFLPARELMHQLYSHPQKKQFDPNRNVDYSFGVLLQQTARTWGDWQQSANLLTGLIEDPPKSDSQLDGALVRAELSCELIMLNQFDLAAERAQQAVDLAAPLSPASTLAEA